MPDPVTGAILGAVGFTATGIAKGSTAAWIQSVVYGGSASGVFSAVTSMAMTPGLGPVIPVIVGAGTVATTTAYYFT